MGAKDQPEQTAAGLRFFGVVTASVSHELNNVNSTIEQIAGLLEDHLTALASGHEPDPARLQSVHERIRLQTRRAAGIIERLNRFAHTTDDPRTRFELHTLLENLVGLCQRLAQQRRVELRTVDRGEELWSEGDPFLLARTIFDGLEWLWKSASPGSVIEAAAFQEGEQGVIQLSGPLPASPENGPPPESTGEAPCPHGPAECVISGDRRIITIAVPFGLE